MPPSFSSSVSSCANELLNELHDHLGFRTLRPELAHQLFDEMLRQPVPVSVRALNDLFVALARAPPSTICTDGPALAIDLFNRMAQAGRRQVIAPTIITYNILIDCCHRACRPDLGHAFFGRLLKTGITMSVITYNSLFMCLCDMRRTKEALNMLLHRMPDDLPNVISYSVILKSFSDSGRSQLALDLLQMMAKKGADHSPDVMSYNIVIDGFFKEGEVSKACDLFQEMIRQGIVPTKVTYISIINALCKARAMDKVEVVLRSMVHNGVQPDAVTYSSMIQGYSTLGQLKEVARLLQMGRMDDAMEKFSEMIDMGVPVDTEVYMCMVEGYFNHGDSMKAKEFITRMKNRDIHHRPRKASTRIREV
uniref:Pentacotripeptide-repeat region of PRORP domain-containing protein n=1 Tax=Aegilops tauschii TaxID=37682 RepID=N1QWK8_AEGTA